MSSPQLAQAEISSTASASILLVPASLIYKATTLKKLWFFVLRNYIFNKKSIQLRVLFCFQEKCFGFSQT
jgi:hypothetical protein